MFHEEQSMKPLYGCCEEGKGSEAAGRSRNKRANGKGPKKPPQRGLGVEQLERLRIQESWKKMTEASGTGGVPLTLPLPLPTLHDHHHLVPLFASGSVPVRYGAPSSSSSNHVQCTGFQQQQEVMNVGSNHPFIGNKVGAACGWVLPNHHLNRFGSFGVSAPPPLLLGTPLIETSKELSSMPNLHSQLDSFDVCLKKTRFNEDIVKGSYARGDMPLEVWPNGHDFLGFMPQSAVSNPIGETSDFINKLSRHDAAAAYATPNLDECVEVVAVHRRGNSVSGRVFMEYEFFPGKDGMGTTSKELELATIGSVAAVGGEASSITVTPYGDSASNSIDLSLKLSH
ncbi:hypothetical protein RJT34_29107 [Clitoria ternatea]|uniref:Uncharacterized protein n=1 Tax=Clitoria ternatea TaxID=43366 RepID=A0AAN9F9N8_CLITE